MSAFLKKNPHFLSKIVPLLKAIRVKIETFYFCFQFLQDKRLLLMGRYVLKTMRPKSNLQIPPNGLRTEKWQRRHNFLT